MKKYRFIDTSADTFVRELTEAIRHCPQFPTEQGRITLKAIRTPEHTTSPTTIYIPGYHEMLSGKDGVGMKLRRVISFTIAPLASERIKVIAESGSPAIVEYFMKWSNEHWPGETWHDVPSLADTIAELDKSGVPKYRIKELTQEAAQENVAQEDIPAGRLLFFPDRIEFVESEIIQTEEIKEGAGKQCGPTARTQTRGEVFKKLKGKHPEWSQSRVAMEASKELEEVVTADTVRNTYRMMGWKWERADRIR